MIWFLGQILKIHLTRFKLKSFENLLYPDFLCYKIKMLLFIDWHFAIIKIRSVGKHEWNFEEFSLNTWLQSLCNYLFWMWVGKDLITGVACKEPYEWKDKTQLDWEFGIDAPTSVADLYHVKHILNSLKGYSFNGSSKAMRSQYFESKLMHAICSLLFFSLGGCLWLWYQA